MLINAAIMIVAAASLSGPGLIVSSLDDAHAAIGHTLGAGAAIIFAVALYAAGKAPPSPGCWPAASCRAASRPAVTGPIVAARWPPG